VLGLTLLTNAAVIVTFPVSTFVCSCGFLATGLLEFDGNHIFGVC
jgi:hypothetical protein